MPTNSNPVTSRIRVPIPSDTSRVRSTAALRSSPPAHSACHSCNPSALGNPTASLAAPCLRDGPAATCPATLPAQNPSAPARTPRAGTGKSPASRCASIGLTFPRCPTAFLLPSWQKFSTARALRVHSAIATPRAQKSSMNSAPSICAPGFPFFTPPPTAFSKSRAMRSRSASIVFSAFAKQSAPSWMKAASKSGASSRVRSPARPPAPSSEPAIATTMPFLHQPRRFSSAQRKTGAMP